MHLFKALRRKTPKEILWGLYPKTPCFIVFLNTETGEEVKVCGVFYETKRINNIKHMLISNWFKPEYAKRHTLAIKVDEIISIKPIRA